jgi:NADH-quinone oxidoreductase subunit H
MPSLEHISNQIHQWLNSTFSSPWPMLIEFALVGVCIIGLFAMLGLVLIMMERKVSSWMQLRLGPNRVGPGGMFQTVADTLKLIVKEGMTPDGADKLLFNLAPFIVMIIAMVIMAPLMFAKGFQIWDINIGVLFFAAVSSV